MTPRTDWSLLLMTLLSALALPAQVLTWTAARNPAPLPYYGACSIAYDAARERLVLLGGAPGVFERIGGRWCHRDAAAALPTGGTRPIVYDSARRTTFHLVPHQSGAMLLYEWDGVDMQLAQPALTPPWRSDFALAYDATRQQVVLFGGNGPYQDTWLWNGTTWTQASPAQRPPGRLRAAAAFHPPSQRVVLFGGWSGNRLLADTWEWDGSNWSQRTPLMSPSARCAMAMAFDAARQRLVLYGGGDTNPGAQDLGDTWEWDGNNWLAATPATSPPRLWGASMAYDGVRQRATLYHALHGTWEFDGLTWLQTEPATPPEGSGPFAWDPVRGNGLLFGGHTHRAGGHDDTTWSFDGVTWTELAPTTRPQARRDHRLAWDPSTQQLLLFGGEAVQGALGDTWSWNGTQWQQQATASAPGPRSAHAMACDDQRQRVVLFGGWSGTTRYADTWEWDGVNWTQRIATGPSARFGQAMAFDQARRRVILFGGNTSFGSLAGISSETWEWDGIAWQRRLPTNIPGSRQGHFMAWDPRINRILMGGGTPYNGSADYWEWNGTDWAPMAAQPGDIWPFTLISQVAGMDYDPTMGRMVLQSDWGRTYYYETAVAPPASFGSGCAAAHAAPRLAVGSPFVGNASMHVDLLGTVAHTPMAIGISLQSGTLPIGGGCVYLLGNGGHHAFGLTNPHGFAHFGFSVPRNPALVGLVAYAQGFVFDPPGAGIDVAFTAGMRFSLGSW